ncbi:MAG: GNAT family N-acetyltransferase [Ktedonobacterales bacterium]|nr:GNAT family N-acetyltransferase [Ktedonobacterales bacterium]
MTIPTATQAEILRDMGGGVILRRLAERDLDALYAMHTEIFSEDAAAGARAVIDGYWRVGARDLFVVAEDTATGQLVSSLALQRKTLTYAGIPFTVGEPEWVLTRPEYRRRGLVRAMMEVVHAWSEARGDLMQIIGGIPNYYRQFGYDMALELDVARVGFKAYVPKLKEGETDAYTFRPATPDDAAFISAVKDAAAQRYAITSRSDVAYWDGMLRHAQTDTPARRLISIIATTAGEPVGFIQHGSRLRGDHQLTVSHLEVQPGVSWLAVALPVLRYLAAMGEAFGQRDGKEFGTLNFWLGSDHPIYEMLDDKLPRSFPIYAWYVRIPDLVGFIRHIAPALEDRLAHSRLPNHTGEIRLSFYESGIRLVFSSGKLVTVEPWMPMPGEGNGGEAAFPDLTFYQLLLGRHSVDEMLALYPDCQIEVDGPRAVLRALFPRHVSEIWI